MKFLSLRINNFIDMVLKILIGMLIIMIAILIIIILGRYFFAWGSVAIQEFVMYLHATIFMLGISYVCRDRSHVSIDILSRNYSENKRIKISIFFDLIFLIPFSVFVIYISLDMVFASWDIFEGSGESGGLDYVYLLKSLIPIAGILMFLSGISNLLDNFVKLKS
tara:strand:- start:27573 stop:28067 length:495 start_codon:yes stop_codon:yes gene_type:complete